MSEKSETKVKSSIRKEIMRNVFFLKKRNVLAIIVSMFYWTICWSFCNNCHSILLPHYPNEPWLRCHDHIFLGYQNNVSSSRWTECTVRRNRGNLRLGKVLNLWIFYSNGLWTQRFVWLVGFSLAASFASQRIFITAWGKAIPNDTIWIASILR